MDNFGDDNSLGWSIDFEADENLSGIGDDARNFSEADCKEDFLDILDNNEKRLDLYLEWKVENILASKIISPPSQRFLKYLFDIITSEEIPNIEANRPPWEIDRIEYGLGSIGSKINIQELIRIKKWLIEADNEFIVDLIDALILENQLQHITMYPLMIDHDITLNFINLLNCKLTRLGKYGSAEDSSNLYRDLNIGDEDDTYYGDED